MGFMCQRGGSSAVAVSPCGVVVGRSGMRQAGAAMFPRRARFLLQLEPLGLSASVPLLAWQVEAIQ
eukprot:213777-Pleurochrysis_carterae.AAC.1